MTYQYATHGSCWRSPEQQSDIVYAPYISDLVRQFQTENLEDSEVKELEKTEDKGKGKEEKVEDKHTEKDLNDIIQSRKASQYFRLALELKKAINFEKIFAKSNIHPSDNIEYDVDDLIKAIRNELSSEENTIRKFGIYCKNNNEKTYLTEIKVCLGTDYSVINCRDMETKCHGRIHYSKKINLGSKVESKKWRRGGEMEDTLFF